MYDESVHLARDRVRVEQTIGERLSELRERSGLTLSQVAMLASYRGRSSVQKFFAPDYAPQYLDQLVAERLARAFVGKGVPKITEEEVFSLSAPANVAPQPYVFKTTENLQRDVPVYIGSFVKTGNILRGQEALSTYAIEQDNPLHYIWHPPAIQGRLGFYAIRIQRAPLLPRFRPGELMLLDPDEPARLGDDVCIYYDEVDSKAVAPQTVSSLALVLFGTLERQTTTALHFRTLDGETTFFINPDQCSAIHRIVSLTDALSG